MKWLGYDSNLYTAFKTSSQSNKHRIVGVNHQYEIESATLQSKHYRAVWIMLWCWHKSMSRDLSKSFYNRLPDSPNEKSEQEANFYRNVVKSIKKCLWNLKQNEQSETNMESKGYIDNVNHLYHCICLEWVDVKWKQCSDGKEIMGPLSWESR